MTKSTSAKHLVERQAGGSGHFGLRFGLDLGAQVKVIQCEIGLHFQQPQFTQHRGLARLTGAEQQHRGDAGRPVNSDRRHGAEWN
jgi:hypothetical protein